MTGGWYEHRIVWTGSDAISGEGLNERPSAAMP